MDNNTSNKAFLEKRINSARSNLLLVVVFTIINIFLLVFKSETYFLFSAFIPYGLVSFGMILCGMFPTSFYEEIFAKSDFLDPSVFAIFLVIALVIVALYLLSFLLSKNNKPGWLIFALILFAIDTIVMFAFTGFSFDSIIDILFHGWVLLSLSLGVNASIKFKKLPEEESKFLNENPSEETEEQGLNSNVLRKADNNIKHKILLETIVIGHSVKYRRVKNVNELVIDGKVYDELVAVFENAHTLKAKIDGHLIEVGYNGKFHSFVKLDGAIVAKRLRLL